MTVIDRRALLFGGLGAVLPAWAKAAPHRLAVLAYCTRPRDGAPALVVQRGGEESFRVALPGRGHGFAWDAPTRRAALFARRPGDWCLLFDPDRPNALRWLKARPGRHFYGHGCFSPSGDLLYASENDFEAARGCIGIYAAGADFERLGELDSGGVGPHDLCVLSHESLLVANGGIETHPDYGRAKLNLSEMRSCLTVLDPRSGRILRDLGTVDALQQLSLRHLTVDRRGRAWFAAQFEGQRYQAAPLVGWLDPDHGLVFADPPRSAWRDLEGYAASVACCGGRIAVSFPRADRLLFWSENGAFIEAREAAQVSALAARDEALFLGGLQGSGMLDDDREAHSGEPIDNHACWLL